VVLGVAAETVLVRALPMDAVTPEEQADWVERAARQLPLPVADLRMAWAPVLAAGPFDADAALPVAWRRSAAGLPGRCPPPGGP
jgi:hypothetical protein